MIHMRTQARHCLAHVRFRMGEHDEALRLCEEILALTASVESRMTRLYIGPMHVETLLALGRGDDARATLATYAGMVAQCQSPMFTREVERLRSLVGADAPRP